MEATIKLKLTESFALGEVDPYSVTFKVVDVKEIDANIFVMEYIKPHPRINKYESKFHHVAYLPEMSSVGTVIEDTAHQYVRQSAVTRTYPTLERMTESKKVMLGDITNLLKTYNTLNNSSRESEILVTDEGYTCTVEDNDTYTFNGELITI
jgi:hypothetical protein